MIQACEEVSLVLRHHTYLHHGQKLSHKIIALKPKINARFWLMKNLPSTCMHTNHTNLTNQDIKLNLEFPMHHAFSKKINCPKIHTQGLGPKNKYTKSRVL
jgi:hypothetical protein